jgi:hypothetical protein
MYQVSKLMTQMTKNKTNWDNVNQFMRLNTWVKEGNATQIDKLLAKSTNVKKLLSLKSNFNKIPKEKI